jgi:hypothetical protein
MIGVMVDIEYPRAYRSLLNLGAQKKVKDFFGGKDLRPVIDFGYVSSLNQRLYEIAEKIDSVVWEGIRQDLTELKARHIDHAYGLIKENDIIPRLNNRGRRCEEVYFSWMRGYVLANYFTKALAFTFGVDEGAIETIGDDDLQRVETFKQTPAADLEITKGEERLRIEMQTGFTGINDIKEHKVREAKRIFNESGQSTLVVHLDLFNGLGAMVKLNTIEDDSVQWITRQQMEGQTVFEINPNDFLWKLVEKPLKYEEYVALVQR